MRDNLRPSRRGQAGQPSALRCQLDVDLAAVPAVLAAYQPSRLQLAGEPHSAGMTETEHRRQPTDVGAVEELRQRDQGGDAGRRQAGRLLHGDNSVVDEAEGQGGEQIAQPGMRLLDGAIGHWVSLLTPRQA